MNYVEDNILWDYVNEHCRELLTEVERSAAHAIWMRAKLQRETIDEERLARWLRYKLGLAGWAKARAALAEGEDVFRLKTLERLLADETARELINRCRRCRRIVRTPRARQCFWCGFDWH